MWETAPPFIFFDAHPHRCVAFQTRNFGWILSARENGTGPRKILEQF